MPLEAMRSEIQRLLRQVPFCPFVLSLRSGDHVLVEHCQSIAFDPRPGASSEFYLLTGSVRMFSTFDAVSSAALLSSPSGNGEEPVRT